MLSSRLTDVPPAYPSLSSRQDALVQRCRRLAADPSADTGVLLDGAHLIREALEAHLTLDVVLVTPDFLDGASAADRSLPERAARTGAPVFAATARVMDAASPVRTSTGIVAIAVWTPSPIGRAFRPAPALAVGLVGVQDPGNVGAVVRSADGLGATGVIALEATAHPAGWRALRGAMGSTFRLPVCRSAWETARQEARRVSARIVAAIADHARPVTDIDFREPTFLLVGNEGGGLPEEIVSEADARVTIPMRLGVNSLNVSVTVGVILYEARRQRALS